MSTHTTNGRATEVAAPAARLAQGGSPTFDASHNSWFRPLGATPSLDAIRTAEGAECYEDESPIAERPRYRIVPTKRAMGWLMFVEDRETNAVYRVIAHQHESFCCECRAYECAHTRAVEGGR